MVISPKFFLRASAERWKVKCQVHLTSDTMSFNFALLDGCTGALLTVNYKGQCLLPILSHAYYLI